MADISVAPLGCALCGGSRVWSLLGETVCVLGGFGFGFGGGGGGLGLVLPSGLLDWLGVG